MKNQTHPRGAPAISDEMNELNYWFNLMSAARKDKMLQRVRDEEYFYSDVEGTGTQFEAEQLNVIRRTYDIPISTKIVYPLIEQQLALLTGAKPYPKLISAGETQSDFPKVYERAHNAVWYESKVNHRLPQALQDALNVGSGFLRVRQNNFFSETTFNVVVDYVPYQRVFIDPSSVQPDFEDAECLCICNALSAEKAEKEYDIKISETDIVPNDLLSHLNVMDFDMTVLNDNPEGEGYHYFGTRKRKRQWVLMREFYRKRQIWFYRDAEGTITTKKPKEIMAPNPKIEEVQQQLMMMNQQLEEVKVNMAKSQVEQQQAIDQGGAGPTGGEGLETAADSMESASVLAEQIMMLTEALKTLPEEVPAYIFVYADGNEKLVYEYEKFKDVSVQRVLALGQRIIEKEDIPIDRYPLIHFCVSHKRNPNRTYGTIHYLRDIQNAINKSWSSMLFDMQVTGRPRYLAPKGSIINRAQFETAISVPGGVAEYEGRPDLPDNGKPEMLPPMGLSPAAVEVVRLLWDMAEYLAGIFSLTQSDPNGAQNTAQGIQAISSFGSQRHKLHGRKLELPLEQLSYVIVCFLQIFAPKEKYLKYFDENGDAQEVTIMQSSEDMTFKVRTQIVSSLPTTRTLFANLLATLAGQTGNPAVADVLTEYSLRLMDMPEADELKEKMDVVKQMQTQLDGLSSENEELANKVKMLENNQYASSLSGKAAVAQKEIEMTAEQITGSMEEAALPEEQEQIMGF